MNRNFFFCLFSFLISAVTLAQPPENNIFIYPLNLPPALSASFSELRPDHFHSGVDLRTGGETGKEVKAAAMGYIYRIGINPTGYGKALYIRHPWGYSTVYGHLDHFRKDIQEYVKKNQYEQQSYTITLYPERDQFPVNQGDVIAWSGNTGGSAGPHLHFEVRDAETENPVNPLLFNIGITDKIKPTVEKIIIYPVTANSSVNKSHSSIALKATGSSGNYTLQTQGPITVNGLIGFGIKAWDSFNGSSNKCGIYSISVEVDSVKVYKFVCDRFSFDESKYVNSHIDYNRRIDNNEFLHKTWLDPGNHLSMYNGVINRGLVNFRDNSVHNVLIKVSDIKGNTSSVKFKVRSLSTPPVKAEEIKCNEVIPFDKASDFSSDGIKIHFPASAFYDTAYFTYKLKGKSAGLLSGIHSIRSGSRPVNEDIKISIKPDHVTKAPESKLCLVRLNGSSKPIYSGGEMHFGYVTADEKYFGDYAVAIDTIAPVIRPLFAAGANMSGKNSISLTITDNLSGIKRYDGIIDDKWALFEYDAKKNLITYYFDKSRIKKGIKHKLEVVVTDYRNNSKTFKSSFVW